MSSQKILTNKYAGNSHFNLSETNAYSSIFNTSYENVWTSHKLIVISKANRYCCVFKAVMSSDRLLIRVEEIRKRRKSICKMIFNPVCFQFLTTGFITVLFQVICCVQFLSSAAHWLSLPVAWIHLHGIFAHSPSSSVALMSSPAHTAASPALQSKCVLCSLYFIAYSLASL